MRHKNVFYPESRFGGFSDVDGTLVFYARVNTLLKPDSVVVEYGCGRGAYGEDPIPLRRNMRIMRGKVRQVIGLDIDPASSVNPYIDQFHQLEGHDWPLADDSADLCICDNVLEHLEQPEKLFSEAQRVLSNGGALCIRTPNAWNYIGIFSRIIPASKHSAVLARVKDNSQERDVFPTFYRCNSLRAIRRMLQKYHFKGVVYGYEAEPSYLSFSRLAYGLGVIHQKWAPGCLRAAIFSFSRVVKTRIVN
jgi:SAM-dependent methyltransferase